MKFQFESPNYTQTPNDLFDSLLKEIDDLSELKVTLAAIRMTMGYHKEEAQLSQVYLEKVTGLARNSVRRGLALALRRGTLVIKKKATNRVGGIYALGVKPGGSTADPLEGQPLVPLEGQPLTPLKKERKIKKESESPAVPTLKQECWKEFQSVLESRGDLYAGKRYYESWDKTWDGNPSFQKERHLAGMEKLRSGSSGWKYLDTFREFNPNPPPRASSVSRKPTFQRYHEPTPEEKERFRRELAQRQAEWSKG